LIEPVVGEPRHPDGGFGIHFLDRRSTVREHLNVNTTFVHFRDTQPAQILQPLEDRSASRLVDRRKMSAYLRIEIVLLKRNYGRLVLS
jgi:hypothetical protein